MSESIIRTDSY